MTEKTLLPCPFCGGAPKTSHRPESKASGGGHVAFIVCYCGGYASTAHQMGHAETAQAAIAEVVEKWNRRAKPAGAEGVQPRRYTPISQGDHIPAMKPCDQGGWVRHSDHLAALAVVAAERDALREDRDSQQRVCIAEMEKVSQLRAEVEALRPDAERLDRLDIECEAYGCEGIHEGNRWMLDGPFRTVRDAIDAMAVKEA